MAIEVAPRSLWIDTTAETGYPELEPGLHVEVAVLGGGITGLTTALLLAREGLRVALIEARGICTGVTGHTTGKLTALHGLLYADLIDRHGIEPTRLHAEANLAALAWAADFATDAAHDTDLEALSAFTYATDDTSRRDIEREVEATQRIGLATKLVDPSELPFPTQGAIALTEASYRFHPRRFCLALAAEFERAGGRIFENTRATQVSEREKPCRVDTEHGPLRADRVVVATHIPFLDRSLLFTKAHARRSYAIGVRLDQPAPMGMYVSAASPTRSMRPARIDGEEVLIVGGEGHKVGSDEAIPERYEVLDRFAREHFAVTSVDWRWSTQDYFPVDRLPYIGRLTPRTSRVFTATGFQGWGLAQGIAAGLLLSDLIRGRDNEFRALYDPHRATPRASAAKFVSENAAVGAHFIADRITKRSAPRCSHLGCALAFNEAEQSWDCPCHGSRFDLDGAVLQGPAVAPLELDGEAPAD